MASMKALKSDLLFVFKAQKFISVYNFNFIIYVQYISKTCGLWLVCMFFQGGFMVFGWFPWFFKVVSCKWHLISQGNPDQGYCFPKINVLSKVSTPKVHQKYEKVSEKRNKVGEKYIVVKKSELSADGTKRDVENTPKFPRPDCILAQRSSLGPPPEGRHRT